MKQMKILVVCTCLHCTNLKLFKFISPVSIIEALRYYHVFCVKWHTCTPVQEMLDGQFVDLSKTRKSSTQEYKLEVVKFVMKITCALQWSNFYSTQRPWDVGWELSHAQITWHGYIIGAHSPLGTHFLTTYAYKHMCLLLTRVYGMCLSI